MDVKHVLKMNKKELFNHVMENMKVFCELNNFSIPNIIFMESHERTAPSKFKVPAYYRNNNIYLEIGYCSNYGLHSRFWSFPRYRIDRTVFGVIAHELGHHIDIQYLNNEQRDEFSKIYKIGKDVSGYEPNIRESFAETFRLYFSNPKLLEIWNKERFDFMVKYFKHPLISYQWENLLNDTGCPTRQIDQIKKNIRELT